MIINFNVVSQCCVQIVPMDLTCFIELSVYYIIFNDYAKKYKYNIK